MLEKYTTGGRIKGMRALFVLNKIKSKSLFGSMLEKNTTGGTMKGNRQGELLTTDDGKRVFLRIFSRRLRSLLETLGPRKVLQVVGDDRLLRFRGGGARKTRLTLW